MTQTANLSLSKRELLIFAEFLLKERRRHVRDISEIDEDLTRLREKGIIPKGIFVDKWIEV